MLDGFLDGFGIDPHDPEVIAVQEDFTEFADLIARLVSRRKELGLTQADIAKKMETKQSAISAMEMSSANPTVQRLQRYARAVGMRLELETKPMLSVVADDAEVYVARWQGQVSRSRTSIGDFSGERQLVMVGESRVA